MRLRSPGKSHKRMSPGLSAVQRRERLRAGRSDGPFPDDPGGEPDGAGEDLAEFLAWAKAQSQRASFATPGAGSPHPPGHRVAERVHRPGADACAVPGARRRRCRTSSAVRCRSCSLTRPTVTPHHLRQAAPAGRGGPEACEGLRDDPDAGRTRPEGFRGLCVARDGHPRRNAAGGGGPVEQGAAPRRPERNVRGVSETGCSGGRTPYAAACLVVGQASIAEAERREVCITMSVVFATFASTVSSACLDALFKLS
jgi:hypothetical protein